MSSPRRRRALPPPASDRADRCGSGHLAPERGLATGWDPSSCASAVRIETIAYKGRDPGRIPCDGSPATLTLRRTGPAGIS